MKKIRSAFTLLLLSLFAAGMQLSAQSFVHEQSTQYQWPTDAKVVQKLHSWQDLKFGVLFHWGLYSVQGICESWPICNEDWITPDTTRTYQARKDHYWSFINQFNPTQFDPQQWATVCKNAGMKYMIFTTKHHDGFCLFDTKETDFSVMNSPFKSNPKANVAKYVFDAFRNEGFMAGVYFSKPDWHSPYYWWPSMASADRHHNYNIKQYPQRWENYQHFVYNQISELMHGYGDVDILWLDGGWCTPPKEDIKLDDIVDMARGAQPGLIVVDRACPGKHENYQTPEQTIPDKQINNPWESCISLTNDWGWTNVRHFKSPARIIGSLSEIVAKGGSLVLGVGPSPEGLISDDCIAVLDKIGQWLGANGEAIYSTVITPNYHAEGVWFTANKDGKHLYAIVPQAEGKDFPSMVEWEGNAPLKGSKIINLNGGKKLKWQTVDGKTRVYMPKDAQGSNGIAMKITTKK